MMAPLVQLGPLARSGDLLAQQDQLALRANSVEIVNRLSFTLAYLTLAQTTIFILPCLVSCLFIGTQLSRTLKALRGYSLIIIIVIISMYLVGAIESLLQAKLKYLKKLIQMYGPHLS
jgi:hypothetical protein